MFLTEFKNEDNIIALALFGSYNKEIDFRLYVNKFLRNNEWLDSLIKEDTKLLRREN